MKHNTVITICTLHLFCSSLLLKLHNMIESWFQRMSLLAGKLYNTLKQLQKKLEFFVKQMHFLA